MGVVYRANPVGLRAMNAAPFMVVAMERVAQRIKTRAEEISPVRTGRYKAGWRITSGVHGGKAYARVFNAVRSDDNFLYPAALERGTRYMKRQRILGRAVDAAASP